MADIQTRALILRHSTDREHDRLVVALSPQHGQLRLRARGTKKSTSKLSGSLEPLQEVDLHIANGRTLDIVTGSVIRDRFTAVRSDIMKLVAAQWLLELVERVTKPNQPAAEVFQLTRETIATIGRCPDRSGYIWLRLLRGVWLILRQEGFAPELDRCAACGQPLPSSGIAFDPHHGLVHQAESASGAKTVSDETIRFLRGLGEPTDDRQVFREVHPMLEHFIHTTFDQPLRSERVLQQMVRLEQLSSARRRGTLGAAYA